MNTFTVFDNGKQIAKGLTVREVHELLNIPKRSVYSYAAYGHVFRKRYTMEKDGETMLESTINADLKKQWNDMRKAAELLKTGKGKIVKEKVNGKWVKYVEAI